MKFRYFFIITLIALLASIPAQAMRCQQKLVYEGDTRYDVKQKCGEPLDKMIIEETVPIYNPFGYVVGRRIERQEVWIYQRSSVEFRYEVVFEDGRVKKINAKRAP